MELSSDFWNSQKGLVVVGDDGAIRFTHTGRMQYAPLLAKYGFALDNVKTVERFRQVMGQVNVGEFEANTLALEKVFKDPLTGEVERQVIRRLLGADQQPATVVANPEKPASPDSPD